MSRQYSTIRSDHIQYSLWLIFDDRGGVRLARAMPSLARNEKAVCVSATLPKSIFKEPEYRATITVSDTTIEPAPIDIVAARDALKGVLGVDIDLQVVS